MAWQLTYTSAEHGLVAGRSGFGTVARHAAIRERLVTELERISVYDRPSSGKETPVIRAHRILTLGSDSYHILSCLQDAGPDYSGRTNHIAHHLICEQEELITAASPALILRLFQWRNRWDEPARYFDESERVDLSNFHDPAASSGAWKALTGNAAHARLLIQPAARAGCYIAYEPGDDDRLLLLFHESLGRLADSSGYLGYWRVTFTTLLQSTDNLSDFAWRGCWTGFESPTFDLTRPGSLPPPPPIEMRKVEVHRATPVQVEAEHGGTGKRKSTWKKVIGSYEGLSGEELQQRLNAQIPPEILAKRKRRRRLVLLAGSASLLLVASFLVLLLLNRRSKGMKAASQEASKPVRRILPATSTTPQSMSGTIESAVQTAPNGATKAEITNQSAPPPAEMSSIARHELDQLPKVPTYFVIGPLRSGVDVSEVITGVPPDHCRAIFVQSVFPSFPAVEPDEELNMNPIDPGEKNSWSYSPTNFRTAVKFRIRKTIQLAQNTSQIQTTKTTSIQQVETTYNHASVWLGESQIVLLADNLNGIMAPFPPLKFGTNWLDIAADNQSAEVKSFLVEKLRGAFPLARLRLASDKTNSTSLSIDVASVRSGLQTETNKLARKLAELKHDESQDSRDRAERMRELFANELGDGGFLLDNTFSGMRAEKRKTLAHFESNAKDAESFWNDYLRHLRNIIGYISQNIFHDNRLNIPGSAKDKPGDLLEFASELGSCIANVSNPKDREQLTNLKYAWEKTFKPEILNQVKSCLRPRTNFGEQIQVKNNELATKESLLAHLSIEDLKPIRLEIRVGRYWWPLILFKD